MTQKDRERLRALAQEQREAALSSKNLERVSLWKRHGALRGERPVIRIETGTFEQEAIDPLLTCEDPMARDLERRLYRQFINLKLFDDDTVVPDYFPVELPTSFTLFGREIGRTSAEDAEGRQLGHQFQYAIADLHEDFDLVRQPSTYNADEETACRVQTLAGDIFGDILSPRIVSGCLYAVPTQKVVHLMGMEAMFYAMMDYPDEFHYMMDRIAEDYLAYFDFLQKGGHLRGTTEFEWLAQGSFCFTDELPAEPKSSREMWGFLDSQESVGLSPEMFREFIFPCYQKIAEHYGLLSYGCCEPVDPVWDSVGTLPNLRKVSISPWCNQAVMAERLRGGKTIFLRKPSPNYLGVSEALDEEAFRLHIEETVKTARGCKLEIVQRDVYTIHRNPAKVRRYIEIVREAIDRHWQA